MISLTQVSWFVMVIDTIAKWANISSLNQNDIAGFVTTAVWVVSVLGIYIGRYRHGDITWYGKKIN